MNSFDLKEIKVYLFPKHFDSDYFDEI